MIREKGILAASRQCVPTHVQLHGQAKLGRLSVAVFVALCWFALGTARAQVNGAGERPFLGWSSWSQQDHFRILTGGSLKHTEAIGDAFQNETNVKAQSDAMRNSGLQGAGFRYINIDGDWDNGLMCQCGSPITFDAYGRPIANVTRFPSGIAALARYIHRNRQQFGLYWELGVPPQVYSADTPSSPIYIHGTNIRISTIVMSPLTKEFNNWYVIDFTKPGAQEYENSVIEMFADWGVDYLKLDGVRVTASVDDRPGVEAVSRAIHRTGRPIYLNLSSNLPIADVGTWQRYSNGRRIDGDIECSSRPTGCPQNLTNWNNIALRFNDLYTWESEAGPTLGWNDPDSLEVGTGAVTTYPPGSAQILQISNPPGSAFAINNSDGVRGTKEAYTDSNLTNNQRQTAMTLWSIATAPLQLGDDLTLLDSTGIQLLTNDEVIAVDQSGVPGQLLNPPATGNNTPVWAQSLCGGSFYVALFNLASSSNPSVGVQWSKLGFSGPAAVRDLWKHLNLGSLSGGYTTSLPAYGSALLLVHPGSASRSGCPPNPRGLIADKTGPPEARVWTITVSGVGSGEAFSGQIDSLTLAQTRGPGCAPRVTSSFPIALGDILPASSVSGEVTIDFSGCPSDAAFTADFTFSADHGALTESKTLYNQSQ